MEAQIEASVPLSFLSSSHPGAAHHQQCHHIPNPSQQTAALQQGEPCTHAQTRARVRPPLHASNAHAACKHCRGSCTMVREQQPATRGQAVGRSRRCTPAVASLHARKHAHTQQGLTGVQCVRAAAGASSPLRPHTPLPTIHAINTQRRATQDGSHCCRHAAAAPPDPGHAAAGPAGANLRECVCLAIATGVGSKGPEVQGGQCACAWMQCVRVCRVAFRSAFVCCALIRGGAWGAMLPSSPWF